MTEYDYSPEAYDRYLATQRRIASWVDQTEHHRPQFGAATQSVADFSHSRTKHHSHHYRHHRSPPSDSGSDDSYAAGPGYPGPMPLPSPPLMYPQQPMYQPMVPPLLSPGYISPPVSAHYFGNPHRSSRPHRRSHSHSSRHSSSYYPTPPPMSPTYPHGYPPPLMGGYAPQGYVMMPPAPRGRNVPIMSTETPSAPAAPQTDGHFQLPPHQVAPPLILHPAQAVSPSASLASSQWPVYDAGPPSYPAFTTLGGTMAVMTPPQIPYSAEAQQGTYPPMHQRMRGRLFFRRSIG